MYINSLGGGGVSNPQVYAAANAQAAEIGTGAAAQSHVANVADTTLGKPVIDKEFNKLQTLFNQADHAKIGGKPAFDETTTHDRASGDTTTTVHVGDGTEVARTR